MKVDFLFGIIILETFLLNQIMGLKLNRYNFKINSFAMKLQFQIIKLLQSLNKIAKHGVRQQSKIYGQLSKIINLKDTIKVEIKKLQQEY